MRTEFEPRSPQLRCHDCGRSTDIESVCHHCGDPVCAEHDIVALAADGSPISREFADLDLDNVVIHHCERCHHVIKGRLLKVVYLGGAMAALGVVLLVVGAGLFGVLVLLAGLGVGVAGYFRDQARLRAIRAARPALPLVPVLESAEIVERISGRLTLDEDGTYSSVFSSPSTPATGTVDLKLTFGRQDRERLDQYRTNYATGPAEDVEFCAGFLMLRGRSGLVFDDGFRGTVRRLAGSIADQPFFGTAERRVSAQWRQSFGYALDDAAKPDHLPLWLTPSLMPEQDKRTIELELQWVPFRTANDEVVDLDIESLQELHLEVPVAWGNVESVSSATEEGTVRHYGVSAGADAEDGMQRRTISWVQGALSARERREMRLAISVRFEKQVDPSHVLRGRLRARFHGTLSGLTAVDLTHPLGGRREDVALAPNPERVRSGPAVRTEVDASFALSLRQIRYQAVRKVPDRKVLADGERQENTEFPGVIPDYETVIELTNEISKHCYIKRVLENPPRGTGAGNSFNRYWNIAGRRYSGVFPVDFQIVLTGEENAGGVRAAGGDSIVGLTVTGSYANDSMFERIGMDWSELHAWISDVLKRPRSTELAGDGLVLPAARVERTQEPVDSAPAPADGAGARERKLAELWNALLAGNISEPMYERLRSEIEQQTAG